jgi:hypothetical protein
MRKTDSLSKRKKKENPQAENVRRRMPEEGREKKTLIREPRLDGLEMRTALDGLGMRTATRGLCLRTQPESVEMRTRKPEHNEIRSCCDRNIPFFFPLWRRG